MSAITLVLAGGIGARLVQLQLIQGKRNRQLAEENRIRLVPAQPIRGNIFDRHGEILASSKLSHSLFLWPAEHEPEEWPKKLEPLCKILDKPCDLVLARLEKAGYNSPLPIRLARNLNPRQVTAIEEYRQELKGMEVDIEAIRYYPNGEVAAHVLGYTGEIDDESLDDYVDRYSDEANKRYRLGDVVGLMGAEAAFESQLRGEWGGKQVEVDSRGQVLEILGERQTYAGEDVTLTLDLELQKAAEAALGDTQGAIVAIDPRDGAVLAMVSRPTFDPNIFSKAIDDDTWKDIQGKDHPFVNRALQGFPPASTFKIVTTTAAIESGAFPHTTVLPTFPNIVAGGITFWDWNNAGFGPLSFAGAMAWSSDTFFYQTAQKMGAEPLIDWTRRYGFGSKTGIEIATEEAAGLVPDNTWKVENIGYEWFQGDTINMSIGQGFLQASPLQVAVMFAVPANGGDLVTPHLFHDESQTPSTWREPLGISPETIDVLNQGLREVITYGTGAGINTSSIPPFVGKSGTAEAPPYESHTWFGAYGPMDDPEVAIVAFGEHSGQGGGSFTGPKVLKVLQAYFAQKQARESGSTAAVR
ncbi:MAG: penicillin-binding protein 2 [Geitlerinemataceae cyanobacterium]